MSVPLAAPLTPEQIARRSRSSFLVSFAFLRPRRRRALTAIYAFCRVVDDAVDDAPDAARAREDLDFWLRELDAAYGGEPRTRLGRALQAAAGEFGVPRRPLAAVVEGVAMDLDLPAFGDLEALEEYCGKVASAVGLACLPVFGAAGETAERYADRLGKALQLTNILRDLRSDAEDGRVYAPRDWLRDAGVELEWLRGTGPEAAYRADGPVARVVERLAQAAATRFGEAEAALKALPRRARRGLLPARIMGRVYREILERLHRRGGDLRGPRVRIGKLRKLTLALAVFCGGRG